MSVSLSELSITAVQKVAHRFIGRCYVDLVQEGNTVVVNLKPKRFGADVLEFSQEFKNQLLDQALREKVAAETEQVRNLILAHALSAVTFVHPELETDEPFDDPKRFSTPDEKLVNRGADVAEC